jgi:hypothetical protein
VFNLTGAVQRPRRTESAPVFVEQRRLGDDCSVRVALDLPSRDLVVAGRRLAVGVTEVLL